MTIRKKRVLLSYCVDVDAVAGWLGSFGGEDSANDISRRIWAGTVGAQRLLKKFKKYDIWTTWFIPGHSLESFPEDMGAVRDAGHGIGLHGYSHENSSDMTIQQQHDVLDKTFKLLTDFAGKPPRGSVAPWWETSAEGAQLLLDYGTEYDHSLSHHDCQAYYLRTGDKWTKIDYTKKAEEWMKPLERGNMTQLVEIPGNWYIDDLPPMMFIKAAPNSHGYVNPRDVEDIWRDSTTSTASTMSLFSRFPSIWTCQGDHKLIEYFKSHEGVEFVAMEQINDEFRRKNPRPVRLQ